VKFFTLVLALSVAIVAWLQWWVALNKLRLDLFDRRYKVYDATRKFLAAILQEAKFTQSELFEFFAGTSDAEFLFGADVVEHLAQIRNRAIDLRKAQTLLEHGSVGDERSRCAQAEHDELSWLNDQITAISKTFAAYLGFANVKLKVWPSLKLFSANR
jgi:hypothetical protein